MERIYKYPIEVADLQAVMMPKSAKVLTCQIQANRICLWAHVDDQRPIESRNVAIRGTGHALGMAETWDYVGTLQLNDGYLIFHVFIEPVRVEYAPPA